MKSLVVVANGKSVRFGKDKLESQLFDKTLLENAVDVFRGVVDEIIVVGTAHIDGAKTVAGGATRFLSVKNGLNAVDKGCTLVAIHDGARPFVSKDLVNLLFEQAQQYGSAVPRLPVVETLWGNGVPQDRSAFFTVQTPQVFNFDKIRHAFDVADGEFTDESTLWHSVYGQVHFVQGQCSNKKVTVLQDLPIFRTGIGFDVHAFVEGSEVILGGVHIPYCKKLAGHSDADVLAHAVCDAILSACGERDIGVQFPDNDDRYLGADSLQLLSQCVDKARDKGFGVENLSAVVVCQAPKIALHIPQMAQNLAKVLKIDASCVNISATTTEHLGALGNGDGIAAQAQVLLSKKI